MEEAEALARASVKEQLGDALRSIAEDAAPPGGHALIIDGKALLHALSNDVKASLLAVSPPPDACIWSDTHAFLWRVVYHVISGQDERHKHSRWETAQTSRPRRAGVGPTVLV